MSGLLRTATERVVAGMTNDELVKWWRDLYGDPEYSHPEMDIQKVIEDELAKRGQPYDFDTLSAGVL